MKSRLVIAAVLFAPTGRRAISERRARRSVLPRLAKAGQAFANTTLPDAQLSVRLSRAAAPPPLTP